MARGGRATAPVPPPDPPPAASDSDSPQGSPQAPPAPLSAEQRQQQLQRLREQIAALAAEGGRSGGSLVGSPTPPPPTHTPRARPVVTTPPHEPDARDAHTYDAPPRAHTPPPRAPAHAPAVHHTDDEDSEVDGEEEPAPRVHTSISPASLADLLRGSERDLPLQHSPRNPFPRAPSLQTRAGHYDPAAAGDSVHAKVHSALQRIHKDTALDLVKTELCTLVPVSSLLFDIDEFLEEAAQVAASETWLRGKDAERLLRAALRQLRAARELNAERIGELRGATKSRHHREAIASILYDQEAAMVGATSRVEDLLSASFQARTVAAHVASIARDSATAVRSSSSKSAAYAPRSAAQLLRGGAKQRTRRAGSSGGEGSRDLPAASPSAAGAPSGEARGKGRGRGGRCGERSTQDQRGD
mmetsp:Transcript_22824/g.54940  ORF Transcript_22824/g.54940 Transcript_22824/m.54940 type:complete len:415 (-) Transcript_22824:29-1273(-)